MAARNVLRATHISKSFHDPINIPVLKNISLTIDQGEFVSITGKSGCGKSTLLYILSTMDTDYEGELVIDGSVMKGKTERELARVRNEKIGFVFQFHYLLNEFTVLENVMLPGLKLASSSEEHIRARAMELLRLLDIHATSSKKARQLSGGEKQRVAIARALINRPAIILCDEPTGNLDKTNSESVFNIFNQLTTEHHQALLVVTHDQEFAKRTHRIIEMEDGRIVSSATPPEKKSLDTAHL
ncbi:ABC transporter ATP-binding protein [Chryseolinea lacunae]|uniref:ABC transporter ATP-binding protein n=1 Tax=Chryseolinea lacunae TaxID=2801331 RepID=A0ABS1KNN0_9BACT|nr:ABC transporter ATP-binding protein [Chryseolinea lacunae]MBL0741031.1 ABC transporter ATP-binding protein [Chryseolinea lacunae]